MPYANTEDIKTYHKDKMRNWDRQGLCVRCGGPRDEKIKQCRECQNESNAVTKQIVQGYIDAGKCRCGRDLDTLKRTCSKCLNNSVRVLRNLKFQVIAGYGGKCSCCGIQEWEFMSVDHVTERGVDERNRLGSKAHSNSFYRKIIAENFPPCYQLLCYNCNMSLGFYGYCPHHPEITRLVFKNRAKPSVSADLNPSKT